jgi:hypothetical protein
LTLHCIDAGEAIVVADAAEKEPDAEYHDLKNAAIIGSFQVNCRKQVSHVQ